MTTGKGWRDGGMEGWRELVSAALRIEFLLKPDLQTLHGNFPVSFITLPP